MAAVADWSTHWLRGGFPDSLLAQDEEQSVAWRRDFICTFLNRDIPQFGYNIPSQVMERLWRLLAHYHGQTINYTRVAEAAGLAVPTLKRYLDLLADTYMIRRLAPLTSNLKKRVVKMPKDYLRDSGLLHSLLDVHRYDALLAHPINGASFEGYAIENT